MDDKILISELKAIVKEFCEARNWDQFHNPKDLSIGIVSEAAELIEHFRFKSEQEMIDIIKDSDKRTAISEEMSDILFFILRFAQMYDIDLAKEFLRKISLNEKKYPVEKFKGSNKKYSEV